MDFKSTGVREIDLILFAIAPAEVTEEIQAAADRAAEVWKALWIS